MLDNQINYAQHNAPPVMGLTQWKWKDFLDLLILANDMQLEAMQRAIIREMKRRE